ncbi:MAG: patatin-like phospholipase family protein [Candidatus Bipolaricaulota bacterium]|nr:patatin-like phospholipase family protein [Candidatus Bipolaricaulota bacterium]MDW8126417.1 patatin-like phospholipase family protein [Candidatus Bipolaricaulota bacterium]
MEKRVGLALGSGGARGAAHVGVLKVLEREGIKVSAIAGASIGAMVGGAYAAGLPLARIEEEWLTTSRAKLLKSFLPTFPRTGLTSGSGLRRYLREILGEVRIEDLPVPFAAVATDLDTGKPVVLRSGPLVEAIRASTAIPGVFQPVRWEGRLLVDGGLVEPLPVRVCRELGAEVVIAVDTNPAPRPISASQGRHPWELLSQTLREGLLHRPWVPASLGEVLAEYGRERPSSRPLPGIFEILNQAAAILVQEVLRLKLILEPPEIYIRPAFREERSYLRAKENIRAGEEAMEAALPTLFSLLGQEASSPR